MRVAEVWMDSYKKFYYATRPDLKGKDFGDISKRLALKEKLECKSFKWFLDTVYPELVIPDENVLAWGEVRNPDSALCLDTLGREEGEVMGLFYCHGGGGNQALSLTQRLELRHEEFCLDVARPGDVVRLLECHGLGGNQKWEHTPVGVFSLLLLICLFIFLGEDVISSGVGAVSRSGNGRKWGKYCRGNVRRSSIATLAIFAIFQKGREKGVRKTTTMTWKLVISNFEK